MDSSRVVNLAQRRKDRDGIRVGMAVILAGFDALNERGPTPALVAHVWPDETLATDRDGEQRVWTGERPLIDAIVVIEREAGASEVKIVSKVAYRDDIPEARIGVGAQAAVGETPCYLVVRKLDAE